MQVKQFTALVGLLILPLSIGWYAMYRFKKPSQSLDLLLAASFSTPVEAGQLSRPPEEITAINSIFVVTPSVDQKVLSPIKISGEARGSWFFEANFPIEVQDEAGVVVGRGYGQTLADWMTDDFVPFIGTVNFSAPQTKPGVLILRKNNPSGQPENDAEYRVPIRFTD